MNPTVSQKEEYAKAVCYFLAELLRNHRVSLPRAAEISEKVVGNINLIDTEHQFLEFIHVLSKDFEELIQFTERIDMHMKSNEREQLEIQVREFVISYIGSDLATAFAVLNEAVRENCRHEDLCQKFPQFHQFTQTRTWTN